MSATATSSSPALGRRRSLALSGVGRPELLLVLGALVVAALSLLGPNQTTYDPTAWVNWGRQIAEGGLDTRAGPSWKPLPMLFTVPFGFAGDAAMQLWLVVARAGGLLALVMAFRLANRMAGPAAGLVAVLGLVLVHQWAFNWVRGDSEGLLVALCLFAFERHLDGHRRAAFVVGVAAALLRPEVWPFLGLYGLWLVHGAWRASGAPPWRTLALVLGGGATVLALWFVPEYIGSGDLFRAAGRAQEVVEGSPATSERPFLDVFSNGRRASIWPVYLGAAIAAAFALGTLVRARRATPTLVLAVIATVLMVSVALLAEAGFTGNLRYVTLPAALVCVLAGIGWAQLVGAARRRAGVVAALVVALVAAGASYGAVRHDVDVLENQGKRTRYHARLISALPDVIARAGGVRGLTRCGQVYTGPFDVQAVAWYMGVPSREVGIHPEGRQGAVVAPAHRRLAKAPGYPERQRVGRWMVARTC